MAITKANVNKLNKELQDTVKSIFEKYGMMITASQIRYNDATAEFKITAKTLGEDGVQVIDPWEQLAEVTKTLKNQSCRLWNRKSNWLQ